MSEIYRKSQDGSWVHVVWAEQCSHMILFSSQCVGAAGHLGEHWSYSSDGTYGWADNADDPASRRDTVGVAGSIPPSNTGWITPQATYPNTFMRFSTVTEITDADLISKLEACEVDAPIDRPCTEEELLWIKDLPGATE